jgi:hypothetical protein
VECDDINLKITSLRNNTERQIKCLDHSLTSSDQNKEPISTRGDQDWHLWRSAKELRAQSSFYTDDNSYTGDGYVRDFSLGLSSEEFAA